MKSPDRLQARFVILLLIGLVIAGGAARRRTAGAIPSIETDGAMYGRLAQIALADDSQAAGSSGATTGLRHPLAHRVWPGFYPALTVAATRLFHPGSPPATLADAVVVERSARGVNTILGALLLIPVFLLGRRVGGSTTGLMAAALTAFHPRLIFFSSQALTEMPFAFLVVCSLAALPFAPVRFAAGRRILAGVLAGCAALTRPEGIVLAGVGGLALLIFDPGSGPAPPPTTSSAGSTRRRLTSVGLYAGALFLTMGLFCLGTTGAPGILPSPAKSWYNTAIAYAGHPGVPPIDVSQSEYNNIPGGVPVPVFHFARFAIRNPGLVFLHLLRELPSSAGAVFSLAYWPFALLALYGVAVRRRRLTRHEGAWLLYWGVFVMLYALVFVYRRFFAPFLPLLLIEAAAGVAAIGFPNPPEPREHNRTGATAFSGRRRLAAAALLLLVLVPTPWLLESQIRKEGYAPEQKEIGLRLAREEQEAPSLNSLLSGPGVVARKPLAAFYASFPIRAFPQSGPDSLALELSARGGAWAIIDERNLIRERPEYRPLIQGPPPEGLSVLFRGGASSERVVVLSLPDSAPR